MNDQNEIMTFGKVVSTINAVHQQLAAQAGRAVNISLTLRNWLIGMQIYEYELSGHDRADYGERLFGELAQHLHTLSVPNTGKRQLYHYVAFYRVYPQIVRALPAQFQALFTSDSESLRIMRSVTA